MTKISLARQEGIIELLEQDALYVSINEMAEVLFSNTRKYSASYLKMSPSDTIK